MTEPSEREVEAARRAYHIEPGRRDMRDALSAAAAVRDGDARRQALEEAALAVLEQRCERGTPWDRAVMACVAAIRALAAPASSETKR